MQVLENLNQDVKSGMITITFTETADEQYVCLVSVSFGLFSFKKSFDITKLINKIFHKKLAKNETPSNTMA